MQAAQATNQKHPVDAYLQRSSIDDQTTHPLWMWIRISSERVSFSEYNAFIERVLCKGHPVQGCCEETKLTPPSRGDNDQLKWRECFHGVEAYDLLKRATEAFLLTRCACACAPFREGLTLMDGGKMGATYRKACFPETPEAQVITPLSAVPSGAQPLGPLAAPVDARAEWGYADHPQKTADGCDCESEKLKGQFGNPDTFKAEVERLGNSALGDPTKVQDKLADYLHVSDNSYIQTILTAAFGEDWPTQLSKSPFCGKLLCSKGDVSQPAGTHLVLLA